MMTIALLMSMFMAACGAPRAELTTNTPQRDFQEREEINQSYELAPGTRVEVSSIRGPVEIVNTDSGMAQVQIIRTARTRADLEYHKIEIQHSVTSLVVRGVQESQDRQRENVQVNHRVILKLPRRIDLTVSSISGSVKAGDIEGPTRVSSISGPVTIGNVGDRLQLSSISGSVEIGNVGAETRLNSISGSVGIGQVNGTLDVSSVSGSLKATLVTLSPQGIHINSVTGSIEIGFKSEVNADFSAMSINGHVYFDLPNVTRSGEENAPNVRARIGAGGAPITINSVTGNVRLKQS